MIRTFPRLGRSCIVWRDPRGSCLATEVSESRCSKHRARSVASLAVLRGTARVSRRERNARAPFAGLQMGPAPTGSGATNDPIRGIDNRSAETAAGLGKAPPGLRCKGRLAISLGNRFRHRAGAFGSSRWVYVPYRVSIRRVPDCRCPTLSRPIVVTAGPSQPEIDIEVRATNASAMREAGCRGAPRVGGWAQALLHRAARSRAMARQAREGRPLRGRCAL